MDALDQEAGNLKGEPGGQPVRLSAVVEALKGTASSLLDVIYPPRCIVCRAWTTGECLCDKCRVKVIPVPEPWCRYCGGPTHRDGEPCLHCSGERLPPFIWSTAAGLYQGPLRDAVHALKYHRRTQLAVPLAHLMLLAIDHPECKLLECDAVDGLVPFDMVVPAPLHPARLRQRGFNQADLLAREVARVLGPQLRTDVLRRVKSTSTQTALDRKERAENVVGVFSTCKPEAVAGKSILLIDDVLTTGATVRDAARSLQNSGARRIAVLVVARAV